MLNGMAKKTMTLAAKATLFYKINQVSFGHEADCERRVEPCARKAPAVISTSSVKVRYE